MAGKSGSSRSSAQKIGVPKDVDGYLATVPDEMRPVLLKVRAAIRAAAPKAEECISYRIPTYKHHGALVHFLAHKDYCSFVAVSKATVSEFKEELARYDVSGTTIHFTPDNPLPATLVKRIVKARIRENESGRS